jgi:hypothetical protein
MPRCTRSPLLRYRAPSSLRANVSLNLSIDTDPQQQAAASPLMLVVRSFLRYMAWAHSQIERTALASGAKQPVRCGRKPASHATGRDEGCRYAGGRPALRSSRGKSVVLGRDRGPYPGAQPCARLRSHAASVAGISCASCAVQSLYHGVEHGGFI